MIYATATRAALDFLPFGSGLSTFSAVFPHAQTTGLGGFVRYAHNDYLQAFVELGIAGVVVIVLLLGAYAVRMLALLRVEGGRSFRVLQIAAGIALVPIILHSLVDFNLHIPANAMWFAALAGVLFHCGVDSGARLSRPKPVAAEIPPTIDASAERSQPA